MDGYDAGEIDKESAINQLNAICDAMDKKEEALEDEILSAKALAVSAAATTFISYIQQDNPNRQMLNESKDFLSRQEEIVKDPEK